MTLSDHSEIVYKCSDFYSPENEGAILWNDSTLGIEWGNLGEPILNEKDLETRNLGISKAHFFMELIHENFNNRAQDLLGQL